MFEEIAPTYDLLNHVLSFGLDRRWRRKAARSLTEKKGGRFLDIATGTGDFALTALRAQPRHVVAIDSATAMLKIAQRKIQNKIPRDHAYHHQSETTNALAIPDLLAAEATTLPFRRNSFDAALVGFGVRNFPDKLASLREMYRVLRPGGLVCILELSKPHLPIFAQMFQWYFHVIVPFIGKILSGHSGAYQYLPQSVDEFPEQNLFLSTMSEAGFQEVSYQPLTFGVTTLYTGRKF